MRFERELRKDFEERMATMEALSAQMKAETGMVEESMRTNASNAMVKMTKLVDRNALETQKTKMVWERQFRAELKRLAAAVNDIKTNDAARTEKLSNILRAEITVRERKAKEAEEEAIERERSIDNRARAVEARIKASIESYDSRIRAVEARVESAIAGFRAQIESDVKVSTESSTWMLTNLSAMIQDVSVRVDANDAEHRATAADYDERTTRYGASQ